MPGWALVHDCSRLTPTVIVSHFLLVSGTAGLQMHAKNPITCSVTVPDPVKLGGEVHHLKQVVKMHIKEKGRAVE